MTGLDYAIVIGFLAAMSLAGLWISRLIKDSDDFFVAGRELTPFILAATITATNLSMLHFIGMGGTAYQNGVSMIWQNWTGDIALVLSGIFIVPIMRRLRIRSVPEFLELRYSKSLRVLMGAFWGVRLCVFLGILLYVAATTAVIVTGWNNYIAWLAIFSLVSILYSAVGGAWAVAIMDSVQFVVMLAGGLIVLAVAAHAAGGMPSLIHWLKTSGHENHVALVPRYGEYNWLFIFSIMLLGLKWSSIDQAILQRAFGARTPRIGAKGMVLSGLITTPLAFFWILPGMAMTRIHPGIAKPDEAIPWLLSHHLPQIGAGLLGVVLCGLVAAQISTITADINSVATLFTSDVYRRLRGSEPTQRQLLFVVRISSLACGALMLVVAYGLQFTKAGAVRANLTVVGILDMPLFIVTIVYGLLWSRANWQGAAAGFLAGGTAGLACYFINPRWFFDDPERYQTMLRNIVPIISSSTALIVTPIVSLMTKPTSHNTQQAWRAFFSPGAGGETEEDAFTLIPSSTVGRIGLALALGGFACFLIGVFCGMRDTSLASILAVTGMCVVFVGGLMRVYSR